MAKVSRETKDNIRKDLISGNWDYYADLAKRYGVTYPVVTKIYKELEIDGYKLKKPKKFNPRDALGQEEFVDHKERQPESVPEEMRGMMDTREMIDKVRYEKELDDIDNEDLW